MKSNIALLTATFLLSTGCAINPTKFLGTYQSTCVLYSKSALIMKLNTSEKFEYYMAYVDDSITGTWEIKEKTLILQSDYFSVKYVENDASYDPENRPIFKFTGAKDMDLYLIKGRKLLPIDNEGGYTKSCYLVKVR